MKKICVFAVTFFVIFSGAVYPGEVVQEGNLCAEVIAHDEENRQPVDNYAFKLIGWKSFSAFDKFKRHLGRTLASFNNGIELFIGSADGKVDVSIVQKDNKYYVRATYTVHNDTSLTSLFYHLVDSVEEGIMKTWTQYYIGEEYFPCDCS